MKPRILVLSAGGPAGKALVRCLQIDFEVVAADCNPINLKFSTAPINVIVPKSTDKNYIKKVIEICKKYKITHILPQNDGEVLQVSIYKDKLPKSYVPEDITVMTLQDKVETTWLIPELTPINYDMIKDIKYPCWVRATQGAGGKGSFVAKDKSSLLKWQSINPGITKWQYSEYLSGDSNVGVDMIVENGKILAYQMKERVRYIPGQTMTGITGSADTIKIIKNKEVLDICQQAIDKLHIKDRCVLAADLKSNKKGKYKITEINPGRFLTSSLVSFHLTGYNIPFYLICDALDSLPKYPLGKYIIRQMDSFPRMVNKL